MSLIEGIGDEVTHFFMGLFVIIVVTVAWWTTNIVEQRHVRTVLLLERRRHRTQRRLTNHTEAVTITDGTSHLTPVNEESSIDNTSPNSCTMANQQEVTSTSTSRCEAVETLRDEQNIIEAIDNDATVLRQRRIAFYNACSDSQGMSQTESSSELPNHQLNNSVATDVAESTDNEMVMEHNYAEYPSSSNIDENKEGDTPTVEHLEKCENAGITIKLKYINDDLKLVDGKLDELLGDFKKMDITWPPRNQIHSVGLFGKTHYTPKPMDTALVKRDEMTAMSISVSKRHFQPELSTNKLVRLIFNGQVLQPDTQTLASCGLFDNCVVHCLIRQNTPINESNAQEFRREGHSFGNQNGMSNTNNNREWDLGNFLFAFISFILLAAWYFRYVYAHLYTVTATVGLILITGIFTIVLVGMYFPDNDPMPNPTIRIARERVQPQQ